MICLPVPSISFQVAFFRYHPSPHCGWIIGIAPEAVTGTGLGADPCALLRGFHKGRLDTCTAYVHVLPQLTSMNRHWENESSRYEWISFMLCTSNNLPWMQKCKENNGEECHLHCTV